MVGVLLIALWLLVAGPAFAQAAVTDAAARGFVARQERAWNTGDLAAYFADYAPGASFTDQAYVGDKPPVPYGTSNLTQARAQVAKAMTRSKVHETVRIGRVTATPDGRTVTVVARVASTLQTAGKTRRLCAVRRQTLISHQGRVLSTGRTDTYYPCPR